MLPQIAQGESNKMWIIPSELTQALGNIGGRLGSSRPATTEKNDQERTKTRRRACSAYPFG